MAKIETAKAASVVVLTSVLLSIPHSICLYCHIPYFITSLCSEEVFLPVI